jgi:hypothetical protein
MNYVFAILAAIGLAACAGLRAFLPLFAVGLAARLMNWPLADSLAWLASTPALIVFGIASLIEIAADKIPIVDHGLDAAHTFLGPAAGAVVAMAPMFRLDLPTPFTVALGIMTGASVAGGVHAIAAAARLKSTATTAGLANPILSFIEDGLAMLWASVAILAPILVVVALAMFAVVIRKLLGLRRARA